MMERLQAEAALLLLDGYAALTPTNGRLDFIWRVGLYDLHEGLAVSCRRAGWAGAGTAPRPRAAAGL